jgi:topoisomerase-4 subunit A
MAKHRPSSTRPAAGEIAVFTKDGRALVFAIDEIRQLAKGRGLKLIDAAPARRRSTRYCPSSTGRRQAEGRTPGILPGNRGGKGKPVKAPRK